MRAFISIEIPEEMKKQVKKIQKELERQKLFIGKMTRPENLHLTLKFLNDITEEQAEKITKRLEEIKLENFKARITEGGVFSDTIIKIIWLKIEGVEELQKEIDRKLEGLFNSEERFMSHLTIARVKKVIDGKRIKEEMSKINLNKEFLVEKFSLMKSSLKQEGPEYKVVGEFELK